MDASRVLSEFRSRICDSVRLQQEGIDRWRVFTPFIFDDGDHISVVLRRRDGGGWVLTDEGNTYMRLTYRLDEKTLGTGTRQRVITDALSLFGIDDNEGELRLTVPDTQFGDALYSFVQGILRISDVLLLSRERVQSTFFEDFRTFIRTSVDPDQTTFHWHHPQLDPKGIYPADCYINSAANTVLFALPNDAKVRDATIALLKFEQWQIGVRSIGIFEDQEGISRNVLARFSDVCEKQFSTLEGNRSRILNYLDHVGAAVRRPPAGN